MSWQREWRTVGTGGLHKATNSKYGSNIWPIDEAIYGPCNPDLGLINTSLPSPYSTAEKLVDSFALDSR